METEEHLRKFVSMVEKKAKEAKYPPNVIAEGLKIFEDTLDITRKDPAVIITRNTAKNKQLMNYLREGLRSVKAVLTECPFGHPCRYNCELMSNKTGWMSPHDKKTKLEAYCKLRFAVMMG